MFGKFFVRRRSQSRGCAAGSNIRASRRLSTAQFETLEPRALLDGLAWSAGTSLPAARAGAAALETGLGVLVIGGTANAAGTSTPTTAYVYDSQLGTWTSAPAADQGRFGLGIGATGQPGPISTGGGEGGYKYTSDIFLVGGATQNHASASVANYSVYPSGEITTAPGLATARYKLAYATDPATGDIYAIGGLNSSNQPLASVERYDPVVDAWSGAAPLPTSLSSASAASDGAGHILVFGGAESGGTPVATVYSYTIATDTWTSLAAMPVAASGTAAVYGAYGQIYVIGGLSASGALSSVNIFNPVTGEWSSDAPLPSAVYGAAAAIDDYGNLDVIGGFNAVGNPMASVYVSAALPAPVGLPAVPTIELYGDTTYNASPQDVTALALASDGYTPVDGQFSFSYDGSATPPTNVGTYNVIATFTSNDPSFADTIAAGTYTIAPAAPTITVTGGGTIPYDGQPHPISATALGVDGVTPVDGAFAYTYSGGTAPVAPGSYTATATFTSADPNYAGGSASTTITIPDPTIPTGVTAVGASTNSIQVSWNPVAGAASYNIHERRVIHDPKGSGSTITYPVVASGIIGTSATITVPQLNSYTFYVTSVSSTGVESPRSAPASAQPLYAASLYSMLWGGAVTSQATVEVGETLQVTLLGYGNLPPTYIMVSGPATMSLDPVTGVVTYTPTAAEAGWTSATFTATNSLGSATATFNFHVLAQPTVVVTGGTFAYDGNTHAATAVAYGADGVTPIAGTFNILYAPAAYPWALSTAPYAEPGDYIVQATFTSTDPNYGGAAGTGTVHIVRLPQVTGVEVDGTGWSPSYLSALQAAGQGDGAGYQIPTGPAQAQPLPWLNLNEIRISFNEQVSVGVGSLALTGSSGAPYAIAGFSYDVNSHTGVWTLAAPMAADRVQIHLVASGAGAVTDNAGNALDGEWVDSASSFPSGDGVAGGDFQLGLSILPSDANQDGVVNGLDIAAIVSHWQTSGTFGDPNGDGVINGLDIAGIASHWLQSLPAAAAVFATPVAPPTVVAGSPPSSAALSVAATIAAPAEGTVATATATTVAQLGTAEQPEVTCRRAAAVDEVLAASLATDEARALPWHVPGRSRMSAARRGY